MSEKNKNYDVIIVGGGMVGLTLACALGQQEFNVAVIEAYEPEEIKPNDEYDLRVSAISKSSQQIFENINVWQELLNHRASPYQKMHVWDATGDGKIQFDAADLGTDVLGHIIENRSIQFALYKQCKTISNIDYNCK